MTRTHSRRWALLGVLGAVGLVAAGCGDDTASGTQAVTAADYKFEDLPKNLEAGSKLTFTNSSSKEIHEMVVIRLPDGEDRSAEDLVKLPEDQLEALFTGPPAMVLVAPPSGAPQISAVGDGTLSQKGRYLVVCFIPTGADPAAYLAAAQASSDGPPPDIPGGPPHVAQGMFGEITVK